MNDILSLENRIKVLEKAIADLKNASTIPLEIQKALSSRGFIFPGFKGDGFVLPNTISLSGLPEFIDTAPFPVEYWQVEGTSKFVAIYEANV